MDDSGCYDCSIPSCALCLRRPVLVERGRSMGYLPEFVEALENVRKGFEGTKIIIVGTPRSPSENHCFEVERKMSEWLHGEFIPIEKLRNVDTCYYGRTNRCNAVLEDCTVCKRFRENRTDGKSPFPVDS